MPQFSHSQLCTLPREMVDYFSLGQAEVEEKQGENNNSNNNSNPLIIIIPLVISLSVSLVFKGGRKNTLNEGLMKMALSSSILEGWIGFEK